MTSSDKLRAELEKAAQSLGFKGFDIWHYEKICRLLDGAPEIRVTYAGAITSGDILAQLQQWLTTLGRGMSQADFGDVMTLFLQEELRDDLYARLEQAGHLLSQRIALSNVFVDVPVASHPVAEALFYQELDSTEQVVEELLSEGKRCLRPSITVSGEEKEEEEEITPSPYVARCGSVVWSEHVSA